VLSSRTKASRRGYPLREIWNGLGPGLGKRRYDVRLNKQNGNDLKPVRPACKSSSSVGFALSCFAAWAAASKFWDGMAKMGGGVAVPSDGVERTGNLANVDSYGSLDGGGQTG
jgi:hypothetical protein